VYGRARTTDPGGHRARRRLAAVRPLHGDGALCAGARYYSSNGRKFGAWPESGSDFITAPELSPLFGTMLARQVRQALEASGTDEVWEFGAGSGALAAQLLDELGAAVRRYVIVDLSGALRTRQRERLEAHRQRLEWVDALPPLLEGVVVGNEVLDAMPVQLLQFDGDALARARGGLRRLNGSSLPTGRRR
jgi:SAM-dependent MidA family methyltransferase